MNNLKFFNIEEINGFVSKILLKKLKQFKPYVLDNSFEKFFQGFGYEIGEYIGSFLLENNDERFDFWIKTCKQYYIFQNKKQYYIRYEKGKDVLLITKNIYNEIRSN